jgi:hypothetical protein
VDDLGVLVVVGGLEDDEVGGVVVLDLRPLMLETGVLDRQLVEVEETGELVELAGLGLVQPDPDELARDVARLASPCSGRNRRSSFGSGCFLPCAAAPSCEAACRAEAGMTGS